MKAVVRDSYWICTTKYVRYTDGNGNDGIRVKGLEYDLLKIILQQMNMTFTLVPTPEGFEIEKNDVYNLRNIMFGKEAYIALGNVGKEILSYSFFETANNYGVLSVSWYVPCSVKLPRWSSIFRIFSVELWVVLIISICWRSLRQHFLVDSVARLSGKGTRQ
jgi:hypothetical protein